MRPPVEELSWRLQSPVPKATTSHPLARQQEQMSVNSLLVGKNAERLAQRHGCILILKMCQL